MRPGGIGQTPLEVENQAVRIVLECSLVVYYIDMLLVLYFIILYLLLLKLILSALRLPESSFKSWL